MDELGFSISSSQPTGNITYKPEFMDENEVLARHIDDLKSKFNITVSDDDARLPKLFWIPKLHKNPYGFRFIAGARRCTTKRLAIKINEGLKVVRENFYRYCGYSYGYY